MRTVMYLTDALVNVTTCMLIVGQLVAGFAGAQIRAGRIHTNIRTIAIITDTFVHIDTRAMVGTQLKAHITLAHMPSGQILAFVRTAAILYGTFIHVLAALFRRFIQPIAARARTIHRAIFEIASVRAAAIVNFTFILIVTRTIVLEKLTLRTGALVAAGQIDARVRAIAVIRLALVHIDAAMLIASVVIPAPALTDIRSNRVTALMFAISIIHIALVVVLALIGVLVDRTESSEAGTCETTVRIAAILRATSVTAFTLIDVGARFAIVVGFEAGEAFASILLGVAYLWAAAVVCGANIRCDTSSSVRRQR